jgi:hypothetical protein
MMAWAHQSIPRLLRLCAHLTLESGWERWNLYHLLPMDKRPSAHKYSGMYITTEENNAIHIQRYSPARPSAAKRGLIQHQYYADGVHSEEVA